MGEHARGDLGPGAPRPGSRRAVGPRTSGAGAVCVPCMQNLTSPRPGFDFAPGREGEKGAEGGGLRVPARLPRMSAMPARSRVGSDAGSFGVARWWRRWWKRWAGGLRAY